MELSDPEEAEMIKKITDKVDKKAERLARRDAETLDEIGEKLMDDSIPENEHKFFQLKGTRKMNDRHHRRLRNLEAAVATNGALNVLQLREIREMKKSLDVS